MSNRIEKLVNYFPKNNIPTISKRCKRPSIGLEKIACHCISEIGSSKNNLCFQYDVAGYIFLLFVNVPKKIFSEYLKMKDIFFYNFKYTNVIYKFICRFNCVNLIGGD